MCNNSPILWTVKSNGSYLVTAFSKKSTIYISNWQITDDVSI